MFFVLYKGINSFKYQDIKDHVQDMIDTGLTFRVTKVKS